MIPDPVIFLEPKRLYNGPFDGHHDQPVVPWKKHELGEVPKDYYKVELGKAAIRREGSAVTILSYGTMVHVALAAAEETGIDAEVIDLRTLLPLDLDTVTRSVAKTGRCVVVHEATRTSGFGAELAATVQRECFYHLGSADRAGGPDGILPIPMPRNGPISRGRPGSAMHSKRLWRLEPMGIFTIKLPDIGEGIAEAELVEWSVKIGDMVAEDDVLGAVMTDKATVEVPSSATGKVTWLGCDVGDTISIGSEFVRLEVDGEGNMDAPANDAAPAAEEKPAPVAAEQPQEPAREEPAAAPAKPAPCRTLFPGIRSDPGRG